MSEKTRQAIAISLFRNYPFFKLMFVKKSNVACLYTEEAIESESDRDFIKKKIFLAFICNIITFVYISYIIEAEVVCDYFVCD